MLTWLSKRFQRSATRRRIVIAQFLASDPVADRHLAGVLKMGVETAARVLQVEGVEVKLVATRLLPNDHANAARLGRRHRADVIVWGSDTGDYTDFSLLNMGETAEQTAPPPALACPEAGAILMTPQAENRFGTAYFLENLEFIAALTLGHLYQAYGDCPKDVQALAKAMASIHPDLPPLDGLAQTYFRLGWIYQTRFDNAPIALRYYNRALDLNPAMASAYNNRGVLRLTCHDPVGALTDLDQALRLNPRLMGALMGRGALFNQLQKLELAIADYDAFLDQSPHSIFSIAAYFGRGSAYARLEQYQAAADDFEKALSLEPDDDIKAALLYSLGNCLKNKALQWRLGTGSGQNASDASSEDDFAQAVRYFQSSMALFADENDRGAALVEIAAIYGEQGDVARAVELLDAALPHLSSFQPRQRAARMRQEMAATCADRRVES